MNIPYADNKQEMDKAAKAGDQKVPVLDGPETKKKYQIQKL